MKTFNKIAFYINRMQARGISPEQVLAGTELSLEDIESDLFRSTSNQYRQIVRNLIALTTNPNIGLELGQEFKISNLGVLGYAALSSATIAQSFELFSKYDALNERIVVPTSTFDNDKWVIEVNEKFPLGDILIFAMEEFVSRLIELSSSLTNKAFPLTELRVTYAQPENISKYEKCFGCAILFNQTKNQLILDAERLNDPISLANEEVFKLCEQQCQVVVNKLADGDLLSRKIRNALVKVPGEFPTLEEMSARLKMGSRTLRRRLVKENLTYQQILDDTRKDLAIQYLENTTLTPKEIGFLLGYNSVSNFRRAFKGWTGKKLTDFRKNG